MLNFRIYFQSASPINSEMASGRKMNGETEAQQSEYLKNQQCFFQ